MLTNQSKLVNWGIFERAAYGEPRSFLKMSGVRESDSLLYLGKVAYYRCTNPAKHTNDISSAGKIHYFSYF